MQVFYVLYSVHIQIKGLLSHAVLQSKYNINPAFVKGKGLEFEDIRVESSNLWLRGEHCFTRHTEQKNGIIDNYIPVLQ